MGYGWDITIPADTPRYAPVTQTLNVHPGIITRIGVKFAAGCHGYVHTRITWGGIKAVYPLDTDGYVSGDDEEVQFSYYYALEDRPYELQFEGWSAGTRYPHTVTVRIVILPRAVASMLPVLELITKLLQRMGVVQ